MTSTDPGTRPVLLAAVRDLIDAARHERALLAADAPERSFYLGVEAAATVVLRPELTATRSEDWLGRQTLAFREGYLRAAALVANAQTVTSAPMALRLPVPPRWEAEPPTG